jgi:hypothetical protein
MAEKRNVADAGGAVPGVRATDPDQPGPTRPRPRKAVRRAGPAKSASPPGPAQAAKPARTTGPGAVPPGAWAAAGWAALRQPDQPPERLAALAVAELGPRAAAWAGWLRATYPDAPPHGITRLAVRDARRAGWAVAVAEAGGPVAVAVSLAAGAWVRGTVVLRIAAAHGHDPADPRRAGELLELLGLAHPALAGHPDRRPVGLTRLVARLGLTRLVVRGLGLRRTAAVALRALAAASDHGEQIDQLAHRAARFYRATPTGAGQPGRTSRSRASIESTSARNRP